MRYSFKCSKCQTQVSPYKYLSFVTTYGDDEFDLFEEDVIVCEPCYKKEHPHFLREPDRLLDFNPALDD